jgi:hypothetical protein
MEVIESQIRVHKIINLDQICIQNE